MFRNLAGRRLVTSVAALLVLCFATQVGMQSAAAAASAPPAPGAIPVAADAPAWLEAAGGRMLLACAFALGMIAGGALGMGLNPLGGATAISLGLHLGLAACT